MPCQRARVPFDTCRQRAAGAISPTHRAVRAAPRRAASLQCTSPAACGCRRRRRERRASSNQAARIQAPTLIQLGFALSLAPQIRVDLVVWATSSLSTAGPLHCPSLLPSASLGPPATAAARAVHGPFVNLSGDRQLSLHRQPRLSAPYARLRRRLVFRPVRNPLPCIVVRRRLSVFPLVLRARLWLFCTRTARAQQAPILFFPALICV